MSKLASAHHHSIALVPFLMQTQVGDTIEMTEPLLLRVEVENPDESQQGVRAGFHLVRIESPSVQLQVKHRLNS